MKKLINLSTVILIVLSVSCHSKKKLTEAHKLEEKISRQVTDSSSRKSVAVATQSDSSKTVRTDSTRSKKTEKIHIEFGFGPATNGRPVVFTDSLIGKGDPLINQLIKNALMHADNLRIDIERQQDERSGSTTTEQKDLKQKNIAKEKTTQGHRESIKSHKKQADKTTKVETKPDYVWIIWLAAILLVLFVLLYITWKLNPKWL